MVHCFRGLTVFYGITKFGANVASLCEISNAHTNRHHRETIKALLSSRQA